jgi:LEA14-like dessication related protein
MGKALITKNKLVQVWRWIGCLLSVCALSACQSPRVAPEVSLFSIDGISKQSQGFELDLTLALTNPNSVPVSFKGIDLVLYMADEKVATGHSDQAVSLPAKGGAHWPVKVLVSSEGSVKVLKYFGSQLFGGFLQKEGLRYRLEGSLKGFQGFLPIPIKKEGVYFKK